MTTQNELVNVENFIEKNMMNFASYVLLDRALPDYRDGLKPVHRRILYSMYLQKAFTFVKSANISGAVMRLHPHGSTYSTAVGMVQKDRQLIPMLEGKGNFGAYSSRDLQPAADRYSELRLSPIAVDMMKNFDKNIVNFIDNYDGTIRMPEVLPVKFPSILTYAQSGIGVGFGSSIASFNLNELIDATVKYINSKEKTILVPDFATGGQIIKDSNVFNNINNEGFGSVRLRGKIEIHENEIWITEIPYSTTREAIIEKIVELAKANKLGEVIDVKDLTGLKGMLITVTARKRTDMNKLAEKLFRFTPLESSYSSNMNILVDGLPKVLGVWETIDKWISWRRESISRALIYDVAQMKKKLHLLKGLEKVLVNIDRAIEIIRVSKEEQIDLNLMLEFEIDEVQSKEVSNMKLRNINKEYIIKKIKDIREIERTIVRYEKILKSENQLNKMVINGLEESKEKYGTERKTEIITITNKPVVELIENVPDYPVFVHLTKDGYLYKFKGTQEPALKPGDEVLKSFETTNKSEALIFSKDRICYKLPLKDIDETRTNQLGHFISNLIRIPDLEVVNYSILDDKYKYLIMVYSNNRVSKVNLDSFLPGRRILKNAFNLKQDLVEMITLKDDVDLKLITDKTEVKVNTKKLTLTNSRGATGVYITRKGTTQKVKVT